MNESLSAEELMRLFANLPIDKMSFKDERFEISLSKNTAPVVSAPVAAPIVVPAAAPVAASPVAPAPVAAPAAAPAPAAPVAGQHVVKSPLVGIFYRSPAPGQPEFVKVGDKVRKGQPLCIVEAMKVMNTVESDADGEIVGVVPASGDLVQYGSDLFVLKKD